MHKEPIRVCIPVFPQCDPSIIYGVFDTLWSAGRLWNWLQGRPAGNGYFKPSIVGGRVGRLDLATGVSIIVQESIDDVPDTDLIFVPNVLVDSPDSLNELDRSILAWIKQMHGKGAHLYAVCGGSMVLAAAGLLNDLETTTHWAYVPLMRRIYPNVKVLEDQIIVPAGPGQRILCAGGASSWQDLCLLLIARHASILEATRVARIFLYQWHREGQLPFSSLIRGSNHRDSIVRDGELWLAENYHRHSALEEAIQRSDLPKRSFDRRFRKATGQSPLAYIQALRVEHAKFLLETTNISIEDVSSQVGYEDIRYFRRLFLRLTALLPNNYRKKFQMPSLPGE